MEQKNNVVAHQASGHHSSANGSQSGGHSGSQMDRQIDKGSFIGKNKGWLALALVLIGSLAYFWEGDQGATLTLEGQQLRYSTVVEGTFEDFISLRGRVVPSKTLYLDAIEGGRVERVLVEDGAELEVGQMIVELSNASLQLSVLSNEARVAEQLNNIRTIELNLEQNRLQHKRNLVDIEYQIKLLTRKLAREKTLLNNNSVSQSQYDDTQDTLLWYQQRLSLTRESQISDAKMQGSQLVFLKTTGARLEHNLDISRQNLDNMNVRAPVAGKLSGFDVEVGQSIGRGERLGQIDTPNDYKVTVLIDEYYLGRIDLGQRAQYDQYQLTISKIYPQVSNGQFEVDFSFAAEQPQNIRRGQTLAMKLTLGDASSALLIDNGAFYSDTGGHWIFVLSADGKKAQRRSVRLGRRNNQFIEVLDGLDLGERIITSGYSGYLDMQVLTGLNSDK